MKSKLISIIGPTATGKTSLALKIAKEIIKSKKFTGVDIISVDSRQVYKGLEILSGADIPEKLDPKIKIHGVSIIAPNQEWSLAHFINLASEIIGNAEKTNRLVILVGGTGLYHDRLFKKNNKLGIVPNLELRQKLEKKSLAELQVELKKINKNKFESMNNSDRQNPRRLIRAIEIANAKLWTPAEVTQSGTKNAKDNIVIGLNDSLKNINLKIKNRVLDRFENGAVIEVQDLRKKYSDKNLPAFSATGVKELAKYLDKKINRKECLDAWTLREYQYAKRQITWWKKNMSIIWHSVNEKNWQEKAIKKASDFVL